MVGDVEMDSFPSVHGVVVIHNTISILWNAADPLLLGRGNVTFLKQCSNSAVLIHIMSSERKMKGYVHLAAPKVSVNDIYNYLEGEKIK